MYLAQPSSAVEFLFERRRRCFLRERQRRADEDRGRHSLRVVCGEQEAALRPARVTDDRSLPGLLSRRARPARLRRTRPRRMPPDPTGGRSVRFRAGRTSERDSGGRTTAAAPSRSASGRSTRSAGRGSRARPRPTAASGRERPALDEPFVVGREDVLLQADGSRPCLEDEVERRLRRAAEAREPARRDDVADPRLARLSAEREPDLLRQRGGRAEERREAVVGAPDRVEVVLDAVACRGSTIIQVPSGASISRTCRAAPTGSPMSCRQSNIVTRS